MLVDIICIEPIRQEISLRSAGGLSKAVTWKRRRMNQSRDRVFDR
ncbi:unnamed protein product [Hymenolepis diminuta]|uniref:Uncharacterized protein n=1 Tax=Hymenolepis diminuta TaxID=6216 RepID=A0A3P6ZEG6_HYMDI|nr:unnamed protein product [Hymenolepis diminuta]